MTDKSEEMVVIENKIVDEVKRIQDFEKSYRRVAEYKPATEAGGQQRGTELAILEKKLQEGKDIHAALRSDLDVATVKFLAKSDMEVGEDSTVVQTGHDDNPDGAGLIFV